MDTLQEIIDGKLLPWAQDASRRRILMTGVPLRQAEVPEGVRVTRKLPHGPRKLVKGKRNVADPVSKTTIWPRDNLDETAGGPSVLCVYGGHIDFWIGDSVVHCNEGFFLLIPPGIRHHSGVTPFYEPDPAIPRSRQFCDFFWISRYGRILRCCTSHCKGIHSGSTPGPHADVINDDAIAMFDLLMAEAVSGKQQQETLCRYYLCALITLLRRDIESGATLLSSRSFPQIIHEPGTDVMDQVAAYVKNHVGSVMTIDSVAQSIRMSRSRFTSEFRRHTGKTFSEYLTECRIEEAKQLLAMSDWSLPWIGKALGLRSTSYFSRLFTSRVGIPPHEYRLRSRKAPPP